MNTAKTYSLEIDIANKIDLQSLAAAIAATFGLRRHNIVTAPAPSDHGSTQWTNSDTLVLIRPSEGFVGDFPNEYHVIFKLGKPENLVANLGKLAQALGEAFVTNNEVFTHSDAAVYLSLPDGTVVETLLDADAIDNDRLVLRPVDSLRLKRAYASSPNVALTR